MPNRFKYGFSMPRANTEIYQCPGCERWQVDLCSDDIPWPHVAHRSGSLGTGWTEHINEVVLIRVKQIDAIVEDALREHARTCIAVQAFAATKGVEL